MGDSDRELRDAATSGRHGSHTSEAASSSGTLICKMQRSSHGCSSAFVSGKCSLVLETGTRGQPLPGDLPKKAAVTRLLEVLAYCAPDPARAASATAPALTPAQISTAPLAYLN